MIRVYDESLCDIAKRAGCTGRGFDGFSNLGLLKK